MKITACGFEEFTTLSKKDVLI